MIFVPTNGRYAGRKVGKSYAHQTDRPHFRVNRKLDPKLNMPASRVCRLLYYFFEVLFPRPPLNK
jgi:hypothetical protein